jgi:hypothetical protein
VVASATCPNCPSFLFFLGLFLICESCSVFLSLDMKRRECRGEVKEVRSLMCFLSWQSFPWLPATSLKLELAWIQQAAPSQRSSPGILFLRSCQSHSSQPQSTLFLSSSCGNRLRCHDSCGQLLDWYHPPSPDQ